MVEKLEQAALLGGDMKKIRHLQNFHAVVPRKLKEMVIAADDEVRPAR